MSPLSRKLVARNKAKMRYNGKFGQDKDNLMTADWFAVAHTQADLENLAFDVGDGTRAPHNVIFTGVAGSGKTHRLQQLARAYSETRPPTDGATLLDALVGTLSWRELLCLVFLQQAQQGKTLLKVPELTGHPFFVAKAAQNQRQNNLANTAWSVLMTHSSKDSATVRYSQRAAQAFFDKDAGSNWFLLPESMPLLADLQTQLDDYQTTLKQACATTIARFRLVSFHPAYGYDEFVEGIRPQVGTGGQLAYHIQAGAFLQLCAEAAADPTHRYAMLIDEINRANVARVFGELLSLIEPSKRLGMPDAMQVQLAYSGQRFGVPSNVDIYATMNTQDHTLAPLDLALRRRFRFVTCLPQPQLLGTVTAADGSEVDLSRLLMALNAKISQILGADSLLGHSFLWQVHDMATLATAFSQTIIPQLLHVCGQQGELLHAILGGQIVELLPSASSQAAGFGYLSTPNAARFRMHLAALYEAATYQAMYADD